MRLCAHDLDQLGHLTKDGRHLHGVDIGVRAVSALFGVAIGLGQGSALRLEQRGGYLWGQMP